MAEEVVFPGNYDFEFTLHAKGNFINGEWTKAEIRIDQISKSIIEVNSPEYTDFKVVLPVTGGVHEVAIAFINDYYSNGQDRNLWIDWLRILGGETAEDSSVPDLPAIPEEQRRASSSAMIAISPDDQRVYVVNTDAGTITAISTQTDASLWELPVGVEPRSIALDPRGPRAYVSSFAAGAVDVVDLSTGAQVTTFTTGRRPYGVVVSPDGLVIFVADLWDRGP